MGVLKTVDVDFYFCFSFPHVCGRLLQVFMHINAGISIIMDFASMEVNKTSNDTLDQLSISTMVQLQRSVNITISLFPLFHRNRYDIYDLFLHRDMFLAKSF